MPSPAAPEATTQPAALATAGSIRLLIDAVADLERLPAWTVTPAEVYLPGEWLEALVLVESSGRASARRYEPLRDNVPGRDRPTVDDGDFEDDASWGPCQVMGTTARGLMEMSPMAQANWRALLCSWPRGVAFGAWLLRSLVAACAGRVDVALARYNGGAKGNGLNGPLRNAAYVERVRQAALRVHRDRAVLR